MMIVMKIEAVAVKCSLIPSLAHVSPSMHDVTITFHSEFIPHANDWFVR